MIKVLIIEDEILNTRRLERMLRAIDADIVFLQELQTISDSIAWLKTNPMPDLIFMDIRLTDGTSFEIFEHVVVEAPVIFVTAYDEYALKAFEVRGVDYLLKPVNRDRLEESYKRVIAQHVGAVDAALVQQIKSVLTERRTYRSRFLLSQADKYVVVPTVDIAYFSFEERYTILVTQSNKTYIVSQSLNTLEEELDPAHFFRISRQYIISLKSIDKIHQYFNGQLKVEVHPAIKGGVVVSKVKSRLLKLWLSESKDQV
ncbi:LytR/AlgR family response regulator transcription factor [Sphingobacterium griseoflavum]|uniref:DNA-binding response regulator n=1 Tax=Sphingobacterium griseoflavum TaxID=1474952 RepID=A0ABQ3I1R6_9SPHI|nr:LytTR family DNA-binding domain-containing protein [Sphingobacterium griseoflavum]GHE45468.1 DNA-binding response regulator [Sphingobacterium griseoflavum]